MTKLPRYGLWFGDPTIWGVVWERTVVQRVDHVMDGVLVGAVLLAPFYILYKVSLFLIN